MEKISKKSSTDRCVYVENRAAEILKYVQGASSPMDRPAAIALLRTHVHEETLQKHCLATGAIMRETAIPCSGDPDLWETIGILHDIDFEEVQGDMHRHGIVGADLLLASGFSGEIAGIVRRHSHLLHHGPYQEPVEIALQAADSASGLITACALVKGGSLSDVSVRTILKKSKEKSFAAGCDRGRIALAGSLMEIPVFYELALRGMMAIRSELGLR